MSLLTDFALFSRFIPKKAGHSGKVIPKELTKKHTVCCFVLTLKSACCEAKRVIQKLYANSTESAA